MKKELEDCPFCGSSDVGGCARLGTMLISCYKCHAEVKFSIIGTHINDQIERYNKRAKDEEIKKLKGRIIVFENALLDSLEVIESVDAHSVREQNPTYKAIELLANA